MPAEASFRKDGFSIAAAQPFRSESKCGGKSRIGLAQSLQGDCIGMKARRRRSFEPVRLGMWTLFLEPSGAQCHLSLFFALGSRFG